MDANAAHVLLGAIVRQAIRDCQRGDAGALAFLQHIGAMKYGCVRTAIATPRKPTKPAGDALTKLAMLCEMGEAQAVTRWPQTQRVFHLLRVAQERRKANKMCI
jgi:hypothetical protein